jgi:hypothetical protein
MHLAKAGPNLNFEILPSSGSACCLEGSPKVTRKKSVESKPGELSNEFVQLPVPRFTQRLIFLAHKSSRAF